MIHVCYSLRDESGKYSKFVGTSIHSILDNTSEDVTIHILHDSTLSEENRKKLFKLVHDFEQEILFYNVEDLAIESVNKFWTVPQLKNVRHGVAMFYRLLIPTLLSKRISKAIYFDTDILTNCDVKDFWSIDLKEFPIAAVPESASGVKRDILKTFPPVQDGDIEWNDYFNSGVLLMDLDQIRGGGGISSRVA